MNRTAATDIKTAALKAIEALSAPLAAALAGCDGDEYGHLRKLVGLIIGQVQLGILGPIEAQCPDLDDLQ